MSNPTELLNCPFCGSRQASICERDHLHFVMCDNCTAEGPAIDGAQSRLDAAKEWNRRAQPEGEAPQAVRECAECNGEGGKQVGHGLLGPEWKECEACDGHGCTHYPDGEWQGKCGACKGTGIAQPAATLSPLCGAQHAESGKEGAAIAAFKKWHQEVGDQDCEYTWLQAWTAAQLAPAPCEHSNTTARYTHLVCEDCGSVRTDGDWGIASNKWFKSQDEADFYRSNGRYPDAHRAAQLDGCQEGSESNG